MQDVTPWPESFDVSQPVARVLVDGQEVDVESVTVSSELDSAMPERVAAGGGSIVAATGSASVLRPADVTDAGFNPWGDARPLVDASQVVVEAGYRDRETGEESSARQITAQIDSLDGGALAHDVGLGFVDHTPLLDRNITIEPLLQEYPPLEDHGPRRDAGLSPVYITDRVLRHCGFYSTPPMIAQALVSAPMMGSTVPERGWLVAAAAQTDAFLPVVFRPVPWGVAVGNGLVTYRPDLGYRGHGRLTSPLHVSFHRRKSTGGERSDTNIELRWGGRDNAIRISCMANNTVVVRYRTAGVPTIVATLFPADVEASEAFTVLVEPDGRATIYGSNGSTATGVAPLPSRVVTTNIDEVFVDVPQTGHPIGGLQVAFSSILNHTFQKNAHLNPPDHYPLRAFPSRINVNCLDLLKEQAEAELAAMWIDEYGHFRWLTRTQLRGGAPKGTLTSQDNLLDLPWDIPVRSVFSKVELQHDTPTITRRGFASITVSDNRGSTLAHGEEDAQFFEPPANQDWHQVETPLWVSDPEAIEGDRLKRGRGSYRGGVLLSEDDDVGEIALWANFEQHWHRINPQRWLLTSEAKGLAADEYIEQRVMEWPGPFGRFAGENLPIIRCKAVVEWDTQTVEGSSRGPDLAPAFTHQVGPWIQRTNELQDLSDWLAEQLTKPDVILRSIPIVPDPRIQLGDTFWLTDTTAYYVRLRVVVMGKTLRYQASDSGHSMSQTITCRVVGVERLKATYDELSDAWESSDYLGLQDAWSGRDYTDFQQHPLDGS